MSEFRLEAIRFNFPYKTGTERLRREVLHDPGFDPTSLYRFGMMMAMGILEMMKGVEARFGAEGQEVCNAALVRVGRDVGRQMLEGLPRPEGLSPSERFSAFASWVNKEIWASLETPRIQSEREADFDIRWCPLQHYYGAHDCRVQRYLVQGMLDAAREIWGWDDFDLTFTKTIPNGAEVCHFKMREATPGAPKAWSTYSDRLAARMLAERGKPIQ